MFSVGDIVRSKEADAKGVVLRISESCIAGTRIEVLFNSYSGSSGNTFWCTVHDLELIK